MGDEILLVNNQPFWKVTHDDAVAILKGSSMLHMTLRYVGKIPHSSTALTKPTGMVTSPISGVRENQSGHIPSQQKITNLNSGNR